MENKMPDGDAARNGDAVANRKYRRKPRKKSSKYFSGIISLIIVLTVAILVILFILWQVLENYESKTPRAAMDAYFTQIAAGEFEEIKEDSGFTPTSMNSWDDYIGFLQGRYGNLSEDREYRQVAGGQAQSRRYAVYQAGKKIGEVELVASDTAKHGWIVRTPVEFMTGYTVYAPQHATIFVDEVEVTEDIAQISSTPVEGFEDLPDPTLVPLQMEYKLEPMLADPQITATGPDGVPCELTVEEETFTVYAQVVLSEEEREEFSQRIETVAKAYATFISEDNTLTNLVQHLYPNTPFNEKMRGFYAGWYVDHESYAFENLQITDITSCSETAFTGDIEFDYVVQQGANTHVFPSSYHLSFVKDGDNWLLVELQVQ